MEKLRGDRDGDLAALAGREWDAVVDPSGYVPRVVRRLGRAAAATAATTSSSRASRSTRTSTRPARRERRCRARRCLRADEMRRTANYGALKALCEQAVEEVFGERSPIVAGLIVGPHDPTGRFTYWPHRLQRGGEVLAPGPPEREPQFIDVRDLGGVDRPLRRAPRRPGSSTRRTTERPGASCSPARTSTWVTDDFLREHEVGAVDGAAALARGTRTWRGCTQTDVGRAIAAGLRSGRRRRRSRARPARRRRGRRPDSRARGRAARRLACPLRTTRERRSPRSSAQSRAPASSSTSRRAGRSSSGASRR